MLNHYAQLLLSTTMINHYEQRYSTSRPPSSAQLQVDPELVGRTCGRAGERVQRIETLREITSREDGESWYGWGWLLKVGNTTAIYRLMLASCWLMI